MCLSAPERRTCTAPSMSFYGIICSMRRTTSIPRQRRFQNSSTTSTARPWAAQLSFPHVYNGRNKLFFFLDYEGKRQNQAQTFTSTVPTAAFRTGNFSSLLQTNAQRAKAIQLVDPVTRQPLANNFLNPAVYPFNPTSLKLLTLYPMPNLPGDAANYLFNGPVVNVIHSGDVRVDYHSDKSNIFGRFSKEDPLTSTPGFLPGVAVGAGPSRPGVTEIPAWQAVLGYSRTFGGNKFYESRFGYSRLTETITDADVSLGKIAEQYGIPNANASAAGFSTINVTSSVGLGDGAGSLQKVNNNYELDQAFTLIKGNHEIKFGVDYQSRRFAFFPPPAAGRGLQLHRSLHQLWLWRLSARGSSNVVTGCQPILQLDSLPAELLRSGQLACHAEAYPELRTSGRYRDTLDRAQQPSGRIFHSKWWTVDPSWDRS